MFKDFKIKFKWEIDSTFILHLAREFVITFLLSYINLYLAIGFALGVNTAWEWQDGLKWQWLPGTTDRFNLADFLAGIIGIVLGRTIYSYFIG